MQKLLMKQNNNENKISNGKNEKKLDAITL